MKKFIALFVSLMIASSVYAATPPSTVPQGGTGTTTFPTNWFVIGNSSLRLTATGTPFFSVFNFGNATGTNIFATAASTTNLFGTLINGFGLSTCNGATSALTWGSGIFGCHTISASSASSTLLADNNTFTGNDVFTNLITGSISGNAGTATKLATGRTIAITGDLTYTSPSFDGSGNVTAAGTLATVNSNVGSFGGSNSIPTFTTNAKGLTTAAGSVTPSIPASEITTGTFGTGNYTFPADITVTGNSTTTNAAFTLATTSKLFVGTGSGCLQANSAGQVLSTGSNCGSSVGVTSVSNVDGSLTITPTTGIVVASLNLGNANTWTGTQTFGNTVTTSATTTNFFATNASTTNLFLSSGPGLLKTSASGSVKLAVAGTDFQAPIALGAGTVNSNASNGLYTTATTSISSGTGIAFTGTAGSLIGGSNLTVGLDLTAQNVWTGASTTFVGGITFGRSTTTSATTTNFFATTASTSQLFLATGTGCLQSNSVGLVSSTGSACGSGGSSASSTLLSDNNFFSGANTFSNIVLSTTTSATSTNFFATNASTTNLFFTTAKGSTLTTSGNTTASSFSSTGHTAVGNAAYVIASPSGTASSPDIRFDTIGTNNGGLFSGTGFLALETGSVEMERLQAGGVSITASTTIGTGTQTTGLTVSGGATTTATTTLATNGTSNVYIGAVLPSYGYLANDRLDVIDGTAGRNDYSAINEINPNAGTCATSDLTAANDLASNAAFFMDVGHTSSGFTGVGCTNNPFTGFGKSSSYLFDPNGWMSFAIGSTAATSSFNWFTGGYTAANQKMVLMNSGNLGLGTSTPDTGLGFKLAIASTTPTLDIDDTDAIAGSKHVFFQNNGGVLTTGSSTDAVTATSTWTTQTGSSATHVGVGTTSAYATFSVLGTGVWQGLLTTTNGTPLCILANFSVVSPGSTTCALSSVYVKHDITDLSSDQALHDIEDLRPITFVYNDDGTKHPGFVAEEVAKVDPLLAVYEKATTTIDGHTFLPGDPLSVDYEKVTVAIVKYLQDETKQAAHDVQDQWQWIAIGLLGAWNLYLTFRKK